MTDLVVEFALVGICYLPFVLAAWWRMRTAQRASLEQETHLLHAVSDVFQGMRQGDPDARVAIGGRAFGREVADLVNKVLDEWAGRQSRVTQERDQALGEAHRLQERLARVGAEMDALCGETDRVLRSLEQSAQHADQCARTWAQVAGCRTGP